MPRLLALVLALLLVPVAIAHAEPSAQKRAPAAVYLYGIGLNEPDPGIVVMGVVGPEGVRCVYVEAGEDDGAFLAEVFCEATKKVRKGAKVKLVMLTGLMSAEQPSDRCVVKSKIRNGGVELGCEVDLPLAGAGARALPTGVALPGWAKKVAR